ncbi:polysaccharide biosynthesis C-terminal domain-containing protein [Halobellus sp. H-GB7]|uniref:oligosaccharide flippase family protein n=1 Tax=Halobellus sp. H-GB7 TaxID=3069756 RepID=UPI0027B7345F|nr:polysaccharide biosynthesis C-terminal domain-containing protein [Halobellus sp. H-GB7]MDQ2054673.1 polysaccharide biosynthesis C-terminal domain-containing protein [Halobellus sp. H-GB7]
MRNDKVAILHFFAQVVRSVVGFATSLFAARYLGASGLGMYSQALALLFWLKLPGGSIKSAVSKRMSETTPSDQIFSSGLTIILLYGAAVCLLIIAFKFYINRYLGADAAVILGILLVGNLAFDLLTAGFVGEKRVAISGWLGASEQVLRLIGQVGFVFGGYMAVGLVYGHALSQLIFFAIGLFILRDKIALPTRQAVNKIRTFAQYSWLGSLKSVSLGWMDLLVLGFFVSNQLVGIYQASWALSSFLALASGSIATTLFPELSELGAKDHLERVQNILTTALVYTGIFLIPGVFGAAALGSRLLQIYGPEFSTGAEILVILICARTLYVFGGQASNAINGLDYPEVAFRINAAFIVVNSVLNVALVYYFGWYGAAVATLLSSLLYLVTSWAALQDLIERITFPLREIAFQFISSAIMMVVIMYAAQEVPEGHYTTVLLVLFGAGIYGIVLFTLSNQIRMKVCSLIPLMK